MELPRLSGPDFLLEAQRRFAFLSAFDFNVRKAEPDETGIRFEDVLLYESDCLAVLLQRSSWDGNAWITVGIPNEEYPSRAVGIAKLLKEARISHEWHSAPNTLAYLSELAEVLQTHFSDLLAGDLTLLNALWERRNRVAEALDVLQYQLAFRVEKYPDREILELPNTIEVLGEEFGKAFPDHDFSNARIWLVKCGLGELYCDSYANAIDLLQDT